MSMLKIVMKSLNALLAKTAANLEKVIKLHSDFWVLSETENLYLSVMESNPYYRAGSYLPMELRTAFECIKNHKSAEFTTVKHHGQGMHSICSDNVFEFLSECVKKDGVFCRIIDEYSVRPNEMFKCSSAEFSGKELSEGLNTLLVKMEANLENMMKCQII